MLKAAPSFLNVFHRLLASIMQEGRQRGESDTGKTRDAELEHPLSYIDKERQIFQFGLE